MISLNLAQQLKKAGLVWQTSINDFFGLPDRDMDERVFVLTNMQTQTDLFKGWPVITFHGASEWALDYILTTEAIWLPTESQLRQALMALCSNENECSVQLFQSRQETVCTVTTASGPVNFRGSDGAEAYGLALLHFLSET
ncbi:MAG: hypothetical protein AAF490_21000 [Chloroflexota bacterium]